MSEISRLLGGLVSKDLVRMETETAFTVLSRASELRAGGMEVINLGIGQPVSEPPSSALRGVIEALESGHNGYGQAVGLEELRQEIVTDLNKYYNAKGIEASQVLVAPGGKMVINQVISIFACAGVEVLIPDPSFPIYSSMSNYRGARVVSYNALASDGYLRIAEEIERKITDKTRLLIINSPSNPGGSILSEEEMLALVEVIKRHKNLYVLSDEIYDKIIFNGERHHSIVEYEEIRGQVIVLNGFSKRYAMTGWRLGYGIWPMELVEIVERMAVNSYSCPSVPLQYGALAALRGGQSGVLELSSDFERKAGAFMRHLKAGNRQEYISCNEVRGAFYILCDISAGGLSAKEFAHRLLEERGVALVAGTSFGELGEGLVRISMSVDEESLLRALDIMIDFIKEIR